MISQELATNLASYALYDKDTGQFKWAKNLKNGTHAGDKMGSLNPEGYINLHICDRDIRAAHLAWFIVYGEWPSMIDHIDGDRANNRISNLRLSSIVLNGQNRKEHRAGKLIGAYWDKRRGKWKSQIKVNKKNIWLGLFDTQEQAHEAWKIVRQKEGGLLENC